jgi:predicted molibdopterin-dependent oxidoreductase YjgC
VSRPAEARPVRILLDGAPVELPAGVPVAAGLLAAGLAGGGLCFMGTCHQCVARVDGRPEVRLCRTPAADGMVVER